MNTFGKTSVVLASLTLPATTLISGIIAWNLKENNPNNIDVTADLAYLKQILGATLLVFSILWLVSLVCAVVGLKKDKSPELSKLALVLLPLVLIFSIGAGIANNKAGDAEEAYRKQQTQLHAR